MGRLYGANGERLASSSQPRIGGRIDWSKPDNTLTRSQIEEASKSPSISTKNAADLVGKSAGLDLNIKDRKVGKIGDTPGLLSALSQITEGTTRPVVDMTLGNAAKLINTSVAANKAVYGGLPKVIAAKLTGNKKAADNAAYNLEQQFNKDLAPGSGIYGQGTPFTGSNDPALTGRDPLRLAAKTVGTGAGVAGEILPFASGVGAANESRALAQVLKEAGAWGTINTASGLARDNNTLQDSALDFGLGAGGELVGYAGSKLLNKLANRNKISVYSGGNTPFATPDKEFAKQFGKPVKRTLNSNEVLDIRRSADRNQLESLLGKDEVQRLTSNSVNGLPTMTQQGDEALLRDAASKLGYKHVALSETDNATKFAGRDIISYADATKAPKLTTDQYLAQLDKQAQEAAGTTGKLKKTKQSFSSKAIDSLAPIERPVEQAAGGREATLALRDSLDRSLRSGDIAGQYVRDEGLKDIIGSVDNTKNFDQYLIARHARDLEANGIKTGRNLVQDEQLLRDLSPKYEAQAKAIGEYNQKLLDKTVEYGLISKETADYLKKKYPNYVPFERIFNEDELKNIGIGAGPANLSRQTIVQRIEGSNREVKSPLESILARTKDVISQGERNNAAREIIKTKDLPGNPLGLKEIKPNETIGNRSTISFLDNGVKRTFETTPEVAAAAKSLSKEQLGLVGKILSYPTRVLRLGATGLNVGFALANVTKDAATAFINSSHPLRSSVANPKVFLEALAASTHHGGAAYKELVREGAAGTSFDIARDTAKQTVKKLRAERNVGTKALYTVTHPGELLRAVEDTIGRSEEFGRAVQYFGNKQAALKEGKSLKEAITYGADAARNNTVNFSRAGDYGRVLNSVVPYLNAGIQGSRTLMRNLRDRPAQTAAKLAIVSFLPVASATAWALNDPKRKEAYDDIPDYEKQGNIIIVPPNPQKNKDTGQWNVIKIPVSQEIANLNNIVRNGIESLHKDKNFDFTGLATNLFGTGTSLNVQTPRQLINQVTPQAAKVPYETLSNQNLYTGKQIVPDSQKELDAKDQYGKGTSGLARVLGEKLNLSPRQIDNAIRTSTGGTGQNATNLIDSLLAKTGVISNKDVRGTTLQDAIARRFYGAAGSTEYDKTDNTLKEKTSALKSLPGYKSLDPKEKSAAIKRLQNDVLTAALWDSSKKKLSKRQKGLLNNSTDISSYLHPLKK